MRPECKHAGRAICAVVLSLVAVAIAIALFVPFGRMVKGKADSDILVPARLVARGQNVPLITQCREQPLHLPPISGLDHLVSREDMVSVLCQALPVWRPPSVPSVFHELKLWGREAVFTPDMLNLDRTGGRLWVDTLLNDDACRRNTVPVGDSYLLDSPYGIRVVLAGTQDAVEYRAEAHYGQLLMVLGEVGVASSTPVTTSSGRVGTVQDLYQDALMRFSLSHELEFIGCALTYWHLPRKAWRNQFGEEYTFDDLVSRLVETPYGQGSCGGCHLPYTVVMVLRANERYPILSEHVRRKAVEWLRALAQILEQRQRDTGGWDQTWGNGEMIWA